MHLSVVRSFWQVPHLQMQIYQGLKSRSSDALQQTHQMVQSIMWRHTKKQACAVQWKRHRFALEGGPTHGPNLARRRPSMQLMTQRMTQFGGSSSLNYAMCVSTRALRPIRT